MWASIQGAIGRPGRCVPTGPGAACEVGGAPPPAKAPGVFSPTFGAGGLACRWRSLCRPSPPGSRSSAPSDGTGECCGWPAPTGRHAAPGRLADVPAFDAHPGRARAGSTTPRSIRGGDDIWLAHEVSIVEPGVTIGDGSSASSAATGELPTCPRSMHIPGRARAASTTTGRFAAATTSGWRTESSSSQGDHRRWVGRLRRERRHAARAAGVAGRPKPLAPHARVLGPFRAPSMRTGGRDVWSLVRIERIRPRGRCALARGATPIAEIAEPCKSTFGPLRAGTPDDEHPPGRWSRRPNPRRPAARTQAPREPR
jgi:hypothetical protein